LIKNAKRDYFEKTIIKNTKDSKVLWQNVKKLIHLKGTTKQCPLFYHFLVINERVRTGAQSSTKQGVLKKP